MGREEDAERRPDYSSRRYEDDRRSRGHYSRSDREEPRSSGDYYARRDAEDSRRPRDDYSQRYPDESRSRDDYYSRRGAEDSRRPRDDHAKRYPDHSRSRDDYHRRDTEDSRRPRDDSSRRRYRGYAGPSRSRARRAEPSEAQKADIGKSSSLNEPTNTDADEKLERDPIDIYVSGSEDAAEHDSDSETDEETRAEREREKRRAEARASALTLEIVGDLPFAEIKPPENILFVCKLNPVTTDEDLELIFSRFGKIRSCNIVRDKKSGESLQYAFIDFEDRSACEK